MKKYTRAVAFIGLSVALTTACKKSESENPFNNVRISTIDLTKANIHQHYRFVYDYSNNVDSIVTSSGFRKFGYFGSSFSITDENSNVTTVYANTSGWLLKVLVKDTINFTYNSNNSSQLSQKDIWTTTTTYPYYKKLSTTYAWSGGDVVTVNAPTGIENYTYEPGKNAQPGDAWRIDQILEYGRSYIKTFHLPTVKTMDGVWDEQYLYDFDANGRISELKKIKNNKDLVENDTTVYKITYY